MKKYRFASTGNMSIVLAGSRQEPILNKLGEAIGKKSIPPLKAVFDEQYFETDNEDIVQLLKASAHWGTDVFWHPTCVPKESKPEVVEKAKVIAKSKLKKAERRRKAQEAALEGNFPREE